MTRCLERMLISALSLKRLFAYVTDQISMLSWSAGPGCKDILSTYQLAATHQHGDPAVGGIFQAKSGRSQQPGPHDGPMQP